MYVGRHGAEGQLALLPPRGPNPALSAPEGNNSILGLLVPVESTAPAMENVVGDRD
jgi:hypothetical protein